jgi:hypothetical protein
MEFCVLKTFLMFLPSMPSSIATFFFMVHDISGMGGLCAHYDTVDPTSLAFHREANISYVLLFVSCVGVFIVRSRTKAMEFSFSWSLLCQHCFTMQK